MRFTTLVYPRQPGEQTHRFEHAQHVMHRVRMQLIAKEENITRIAAEDKKTGTCDILALLLRANMETGRLDGHRLSDDDVLGREYCSVDLPTM